LAQKKERPKTLKNQRWAAIVAAILAFGMVASVVGGYIGQAIGGESVMQNQQADPEPEDYLAYYEGEVDRLEEYLEEHDEPSPVVLQELADNYRYLIFIKQIYFDDADTLEEYQERLLALSETLVDKEPDNPEHRLNLLNLYFEMQEDEEAIDEEIDALQEVLHENPDPMIHLSLIGLLSSVDEEQKSREEVDWLYSYLDGRVADGRADTEEQYIYSVLLGEFLDDPVTAEAILEGILEEESEESVIYSEALNYLNHLQSDSDDEADPIPFD